MLRIILPLSLLLPLSLFPAISLAGPESCPEYDYRRRFGPTHDQGGLNYCYGIVASDLAAETLCIEDPKQCGTALSPFDIASCEPRFTNIYEGQPISGRSYMGSTITSALECFLARGTCKAEQAPYIPTCGMGDAIFRDKLCIDLYALKATYSGYVEQSKTCTIPADGLSFFEKMYSAMMPNNGLAAKADVIDEALHSSPDWNTFLHKVLVPNKCTAESVKAQKPHKIFTEVYPDGYPEVITDLYPDQAPAKLLNKTGRSVAQRILDRLGQGSSIGVGLCMNKMSFKYDVKFHGPCPLRHAVIVNGSKWNEQKARCEVHLKNTTGAGYGTDFNGWYDLNEVANATFLIDQIE